MARRTHGNITPRPLKDGTIHYRARKRVGNGQSEVRTFDSADDAERWLLEVSLNERNGRGKTRHIAQPTVAEWVAQYIDRGAGEWSGATVDLYERALRLYIGPRLGRKKLRDLTPSMVQAWVDGQAGLAPSSIRLHTRVLSGACKEAVRLGVIANNPVTAMRLPKARKVQRPMWGRGDVRSVLALVADDPAWHAVYRVMLSTGMRPGELRALAWSDVVGDTITVHRTVTRQGGKEVIGETTKGKRSRLVPVTTAVVTALKTWQVKQEPGCRLVFGDRGGMLDSTTWRRYHRRLCERAGVPAIRLHDLRHVAATQMLAAGVPLKVVSDRLGHSSIQITADTYMHPDASAQLSAAERLEAWLESEQDQNKTQQHDPESGRNRGGVSR